MQLNVITVYHKWQKFGGAKFSKLLLFHQTLLTSQKRNIFVYIAKLLLFTVYSIKF